MKRMCCYDNDKDLPHITLKFHDERVNVHMETVVVIPLFLYNIYSHTSIHSMNFFFPNVLLAYIHNFFSLYASILTLSEHQKHYSVFSSDLFTSFGRLSNRIAITLNDMKRKMRK